MQDQHDILISDIGSRFHWDKVFHNVSNNGACFLAWLLGVGRTPISRKCFDEYLPRKQPAQAFVQKPPLFNYPAPAEYGANRMHPPRALTKNSSTLRPLMPCKVTKQIFTIRKTNIYLVKKYTQTILQIVVCMNAVERWRGTHAARIQYSPWTK